MSNQEPLLTVGTKVRIINLRLYHDVNKNADIVSEMYEYSNTDQVIEAVFTTPKGTSYKLDGIEWRWHIEFFDMTEKEIDYLEEIL